MPEGAQRAVAAEIEHEAPLALRGGEGAQPVAADPVEGGGEIEAQRAILEEQCRAALALLDPVAGAARQVDRQPVEPVMGPRAHRHALRRGGRGEPEREPERGEPPHAAGSCRSARSASSRSAKPGRLWPGVFWRPTSMQILAA